MSPEQIRGETLDHRSDIYSLGAMMYRILTGEHPFHAQTPVGVLTKHLTDEVVPPSQRRPELQIDARVEAIVLRAMEKKREARYATVDGMRADLEKVLEELKTGQSGKIDTGAALAAVAAMGGGPVSTPVRMAAPIEEVRERRRHDESSTAEPRLHREDFDAFERSLRRRGFLRMLIVPMMLAAVGGGAFWYLRWQKRQPRTVEKEPNNTLETATLIAAGQPVRGKIGERLSENQSDRDYYRVAAPAAPGSPARLTVRLAPIKR